MTANTIEERKRHINEIKASFPNPAKSSRYGDFEEKDKAFGRTAGFFKLKLLSAMAIFAVFVFLDQNQISLGGYTAKSVTTVIEESLDVKDLGTRLEKMFRDMI